MPVLRVSTLTSVSPKFFPWFVKQDNGYSYAQLPSKLLGVLSLEVTSFKPFWFFFITMTSHCPSFEIYTNEHVASRISEIESGPNMLHRRCATVAVASRITSGEPIRLKDWLIHMRHWDQPGQITCRRDLWVRDYAAKRTGSKVLHIANTWLLYRALFFIPLTGCVNQRESQKMTWQRGMIKCTANLRKVCWDPKVFSTSGLETLKNMVANCEHWSSRSQFLSNGNYWICAFGQVDYIRVLSYSTFFPSPVDSLPIHLVTSFFLKQFKTPR